MGLLSFGHIYFAFMNLTPEKFRKLQSIKFGNNNFYGILCIFKHGRKEKVNFLCMKMIRLLPYPPLPEREV